jgi:hypothetical protein
VVAETSVGVTLAEVEILVEAAAISAAEAAGTSKSIQGQISGESEWRVPCCRAS